VSTQRFAGVLVIAGLVFAAGASVVFPSEYYMAETQAARQAITAWAASNWLWIASGVVTSIGLLLIAVRGRDFLARAGAGLFAVGSMFWAAYAYLRMQDASVSSESLWMEGVFALLATLGLGLLGIAFLRSDFPKWVAYVNVGYAILFVLVFLLMGTKMFEVFPPQVIFLVSLFTGIVAVRRG